MSQEISPEVGTMIEGAEVVAVGCQLLTWSDLSADEREDARWGYEEAEEELQSSQYIRHGSYVFGTHEVIRCESSEFWHGSYTMSNTSGFMFHYDMSQEVATVGYASC